MNPTDLALQTATKMTQKSNKVPQINPFQTRGVAVSTPPQSKLPIAPKTGGTQAISTALDTVKTINSNPIIPTVPEKIPETGAGINKISMQEFGNKIKEKYPQYIDVDSIELGRKMIEKYPEYQNSVDQQPSPKKTGFQEFITPSARFLKGISDVGAGIQEGIDTGLSKLGILPDQSAINKKSREQDESMTQAILGKKAGAEKYIQEGGRIAGSMIANAPANKFGTLGKMAIGATEGLLGGASYNLSTGKGVGSPVNLGLSTAIGAVVPGIAPAYKAIKGGGLKKVYNKAGELIDNTVEGIANPIMGTTKPQGKLFKAQEPRLNLLNKSIDYKKLRENSDIANIEILKAGFKPTDTATRAEAHYNTMKKIWNEEVVSRIGKQYDIDLNPIADEIEQFVKEQKSAGLVKNEGQLKELVTQAKRFRKMGTVDGAKGEFVKEMINAQINNRGDVSIGDIYKNGMKKASNKLGTILDETFSSIPGQFSDAKRRFGAMKATLQDVVKADIKNQRAKGLGIEDTFGRIEGLGDILGAVGGLTSGKNPIPGLLSGGAKVLMGKVAKKLKDKDFLIQKGFEELSKNIEEGFSSKGILGASAGLVDDYIVLGKSAIKTKPQLTDIWKEANKKSLPPLPKKGK